MEFARRSGMLSEPEFNVMDLWHKFAIRNYEPKIKPDLIVFLKTNTETVARRIKKRGRIEEKNIDMSFVDGINRLHEDWLVHQNTSFSVPAPVMVINGTLELEDFRSYVKDEVMHKIVPSELQPYVF